MPNRKDDEAPETPESEAMHEIARALRGIASNLGWIGLAIMYLGMMTMCGGALSK